MPEEERASRHAGLYKAVITHTSHTWAAVLIRMLLSQIGMENTAHQTPFMDQGLLDTAYHNAKRRLLLFDYDVRFLLLLIADTENVMLTSDHSGNSNTDCQDT
jgi:hypothetical protein